MVGFAGGQARRQWRKGLDVEPCGGGEVAELVGVEAEPDVALLAHRFVVVRAGNRRR